jgi:hypothetical protein
MQLFVIYNMVLKIYDSIYVFSFSKLNVKS